MKNPINYIFDSLLRKNFLSYVRKVFHELNPSEEFIDGWYINVLCDQLQRMGEGEYQKLIINLPPRYLKSLICSIALPTYILGLDPSTKIMCISYGDELASKLASDCKTIMETEWYKRLFPQTRIKSDKKSVMDFETTKHGGRFSTTVFGAITGRGADWIIMDDPLKPTDAYSDTIRKKVNEAYGNTIFSRLNNKNTGKIVLVMQRLHLNDLSGYLQKNDPEFKVIKLPIIAEEDEEWLVKNHISGLTSKYVRKKGELLHPQRESERIVDSYKNSMGSFAFSTQYQQNPIPVGSGIIKPEWLKYYTYSGRLDRVILSWDTAAKTNDNCAYSACVVVGLGNDNKYYLLEVIREKLEFPDLVTKVETVHQKFEEMFYNRTITLIENESSGIQLYQMLKNKISNLRPCSCHRSKEQRFNIVSLKVERGELLLPTEYKDWFDDFKNELLTFPYSPFKDQCDALSQALSYCSENNVQATPQMALCSRGTGYGHADISHLAARYDPRKYIFGGKFR